jgi:YD repeat-containing protein
MKYKLKLSVILFITALKAFSQPELKEVVPLSPNAAAIAKYGEMPTGSSTGIAPVEIPLYTITSGGLSLPLALSYHGGGNKVETISSNVGLGWSLGTLPSVSRSVRGIADDGPGGFFSLFYGHTVEYIYDHFQTDALGWKQFIIDVENGSADPEPDMFNFNIAGKSGKFFWDQATSSFVTYPFVNYKITYGALGFKIVTDEGVEYYFGSTEKQSTLSSSTPSPAVTTSWLADSVLDANHTDRLDFSYRSETQYSTGIKSSKAYFQISSSGGCAHLPSYEDKSVSNIAYALLPAAINFKNGKIEFAEAHSREDLDGGHTLDTLTVTNKNNEQVKKIVFYYEYLNGTSSSYCNNNSYQGDNKWLLLDSLREISAEGLPLNPYVAEYDKIAVPPCRTSAAQDYWGFYNGRTDNYRLLASQSFVLYNVNHYIQGADRTVYPEYARFGILKKLTYPTKGFTEYEYESNTSKDQILPKQYLSEGAYIDSPDSITTNTYSTTFTINNPPEQFLNNNNPLGGAYVDVASGGFGCDLTGGSNTCATIRIIGAATGTDIPISANHPNNTYTNNFYLPNGTYQISAIFNQNPPLYNSFYIQALWHKVDSSQVNNLLGGLRIKQITNHDGISEVSTTKKKFTYETFPGSGISSGRYCGNQFMNYQGNVFYYSFDNSASCNALYLCLSTYSNSEVITNNGSYVTYSTVISEDNAREENGITIQKFIADPDFINQGFPYAPAESLDHLRNLPLEVSQYRLSGTQLFPVKRTYFNYSDHFVTNAFGLKVARWIMNNTSFPVGDVSMPAAEFYHLNSSVPTLATKIEINYDRNDTLKLLKMETAYEYTPQTYLTSSAKFIDSRGNEIKEKTYYPLDLNLSGTAEAARLKLITQNRISIPLKNESYINNNLTKMITTAFKKFGASEIVMPGEIFQKLGSFPEESKVQFSAYSNQGDLLEQQKTGDIKICYLWGYNHELPVAEIKGSDYAACSAFINQSILDNPASDQALRTELNKIRTGLAASGAMVKTYTYSSLIGITSETDANGRTTYYEYDGMRRLSLIRDKDNNIIKKICYNYAGQAESCSN